MPGRNQTGVPNTEDYTLGRGIVLFAPLVSNIPGAYRDLGNAPEFNISIETETVEHQSSRQGLRVVDKEVVISQKLSLSLTLDELNHENLALVFSGESTTFTNPAIAGFAEHEMIAAVELGRHYDIKNAAGARAYDVLTADLLVENADTPGVLVENTDYTLDSATGTLFFLSSATGISAGEAVDVTLTARPAAGTVDEVRGLSTSAVVGALKFISINPANADKKVEYQFHQVSLKPTGDFSLISDEFTTMTLEGAAERNLIASPLSPTLTVRTVV
jgi:hypothetical protein